MEQEYI